MSRNTNRLFFQIFLFIGFLYLFFVSIEMMSSAFKLFGKGFTQSLLKTTTNPLVGLFIGIVTTSLVQSSSSTTSILVGLVASGSMPIRYAIPVVMGANIGTTVTNIIVSMAHIGRKHEFSRALAGATVHDFFNVLSVAVFFPLEITTHFLEKTALFLSETFQHAGGFTFISPLKTIVQPAAHFLIGLLRGIITSPSWLTAVFVLVISLALLFLALKYMVTSMKKIIIGKVENLIDQYLFKNPARSFLLGLIFTSIIQSSSATTSLIVPILGAGILTIQQIYPYVLGTNIGTTVTAILASLVTRNQAALTVAFAHLLFNISGTVVFYPLRVLPITMALKYGNFLSKHRVLAPIFVLMLFFIIPLLFIFLLKGGL
jgi:sodium-dependent phosphate cotransporter